MITVAQIVACVHCLTESLAIIDTLLQNGIDSRFSQAGFRSRAGHGIGVVEAPRGTLFHEYDYDAKGSCRYANHVIPTAQNLANIEADMRAFVPEIIAASEDVIRHQLEMLVRAYDPCISCATHVIDLR
jgi:coenzyme F420-reducing hydrogenase alpha subunit